MEWKLESNVPESSRSVSSSSSSYIPTAVKTFDINGLQFIRKRNIHELIFKRQPNFYPVKQLYNIADQGPGSPWTDENITITQKDINEFLAEPVECQTTFVRVNLFFATSDCLVADNIDWNFLETLKNYPDLWHPSAYCYNYQRYIEIVHAMTYHKMLRVILRSDDLLNELISMTPQVAALQAKLRFINQSMDPSLPLEEQLLRFALVEHMFFSSSFAVFFYFGAKGIMHEFKHANEAISRDEGLHVSYAIQLLRALHVMYNWQNPEEGLIPEAKCKYASFMEEQTARPEYVNRERAHKLIIAATEIEKQFVEWIMPKDLPGMTKDQMMGHVENQANLFCELLNLPPVYPERLTTPLEFMDRINMRTKNNFFDANSADYAAAKGSFRPSGIPKEYKVPVGKNQRSSAAQLLIGC